MTQETKARTELPGMALKRVETETSGIKYEVEVLQAESLQAILDAYKAQGKNGEEVLVGVFNAANEQSAKQQKGKVRSAIEAAEKAGTAPEDDEAVQAAIEEHQAKAPGFLIGAPRGGGGKRHESGLTAKQRTELGTAVAMEMARTGQPPSKARMDEIAKELGIDPSALAHS